MNNLEKSAKEVDRTLEKGKRNPITEGISIFEEFRRDYFKLKERFKHDAKKKKEIEQDWNDFILYEEHVLSALDGMNFAYGAYYDELWSKIDESYIKMREIQKRFEEQLNKSGK